MHLSHSRLATTIIAGLFVAVACTSAATPAPVVTATPPTSPTSPPPTSVPTPIASIPVSAAPLAKDHVDPALEALLPDSIDGLPLAKESHTADQINERSDPRLVSLGKEPADLTIAFAFYMRDRLINIWVERLDGVSGGELLAATLEGMGGAPVSQTSLGGREVTLVPDGRGLTTWYYATDDLLFLIQATGEGTVAGGEETVARILTGLP